jgi:hypothetical protein
MLMMHGIYIIKNHGQRSEEHMKNNKYFWFNFLTLIFLSYQMNAQPFYYYNDTTSMERFWRINLQNGNKDIFFKDTINPSGEITWDPTQTWVFINGSRGGRSESYFSLYTIKANDTTITHLFPDQNDPENNGRQSFTQEYWEWIRNGQRVCDGIAYNPVKNVFYVSRTTDFIAADSAGTWNNFLNYQETAVYDAATFALLETLPVDAGWITSISSVSDDGNYLYLENWDYQQVKAIGKYSLLTKQLIINKNLSEIYVPGGYNVADSKKGNYLIAFLYPRVQMEDKKFAVYNIDKDTVYTPISFPMPTHEYLSSNGKYIIIEETPVNPNSQTTSNMFYHPGRISIFNGVTGQLIKKYTLPPDGKVLVFDNYPNMLYYYLPKQNRSINIDLSQFGPDTCTVKLLSSTGSLLTTGTLQYRDSTWKDATNNNDGTFTVATTRKKLSLRMTYEYGTQTKSGITVKNDTTIIFQTKNVAVNLQTSTGNPLDTGTVQYDAGGWKDFGTTSNGVVTKELLPINYIFKMTYNNASNEKKQNIDSSVVVLFQTVNAVVQLQNNQGSLMDTGTVQYNAGGWKPFGITTNGIASKELLANQYNFRMTYAYANKDKQQDIGTNSTVVFQTVNAIVQLENSQGILLDTGTVQYNSGGWKNFGTTTNGIASKQLLSNQYNFRMTYAFINNDKVQNLDSSNTVNFSTVLCTVRVINSSGQVVNNAVVTYNAGGFKAFGTTVNGITTKELLPANITFKAQSGKTTQTKAQDITTNPNVEISLP